MTTDPGVYAAGGGPTAISLKTDDSRVSGGATQFVSEDRAETPRLDLTAGDGELGWSRGGADAIVSVSSDFSTVHVSVGGRPVQPLRHFPFS